MTFTPQAPAVVVLRKGDRVLIAMAEDPSEEEAQQYMSALAQSFPGVQFVVLGNTAGMAILPYDPNAPRRVEAP